MCQDIRVETTEEKIMADGCAVEIFLYRAALFDMDGVIADTMPLHFESWRRAFEELGISIDQRDVYMREGMTSTAMARDIAGSRGVALSDDVMKKLVDDKTRMFNVMVGECARAYDGVEETLKMLRNNGLKLALVTGSRRESARGVLRKIGLENAFEVLIAAEDVAEGKPGPEPYARAMTILNLPALDCLVVENAPLGVMSAKAAKAGYVIALATTLDASCLAQADEVVPSFSELGQCFARSFEARPGRTIM
jgi:beta-phosphoglucomutase